MAVNDSRPFFLNLLKIRLPLPGFVSFLHRVSGVFMFLAIPFMMYLLDLSLRGPMGFEQAGELLSHPLIILCMLVLLWSLLHHLFAGIRFLFIDFEIGVDKQPARRSAWLVFAAEAVVFIAIVLGVCL